MAALGAQSIASSYEQLLHVDADGGGNSTTHVSVKDGDNGTTFGFTIASDALMMSSTNRLEFGDTGTYIHQSADGVLDLVSDTEIEINATTVDINGAVEISGDLTLASTLLIAASTEGIFGSADTNTGIRWEGSDALAFDTGGTERMLIDVNGAVTMPTQPAFCVNPASTQSDIAVGSVVTIIWGTERFDQGGDFNNTGGGTAYSFAAPVTGRYQLQSTIAINSMDVTATTFSLAILTSNKQYERAIAPDQLLAADDKHSMSISVLADMDASDTATVFVYQTGGAAQADISTDSFFSGFLAC